MSDLRAIYRTVMNQYAGNFRDYIVKMNEAGKETPEARNTIIEKAREQQKQRLSPLPETHGKLVDIVI